MIQFIWEKFYVPFSILGFFRLSNLCPHSLSSFYFTRHLAAGDIFFDSDKLKVLIKWSKTLQSSDKVKLISLPKLGRAAIFQYRVLFKMFKLYSPEKNDPLFQFRYQLGWKVLIDSKLEKPCPFSVLKWATPISTLLFII